MPVYKFRNCLLNTLERLVIKDNECIELTTRTFDVLLYLIENAGKVVSKDEILGHVWSGNFVEESNLPVHISKLRKSLGETREVRFIETVQGTGYRFVAPVNEAPENEWNIATATHRNKIDSENLESSYNSIAVLPLENQTGDSTNEYLSDGFTEGLINSLSNLTRLRVIARNTVFRFKGNIQDYADIGRKLGVSTVVTGRLRLANGDYVVSVELVRTDNGAQIWGRLFQNHKANLLALQEEISFALAEQLTAAKGSENTSLLVHSLTRDPESYRLYLKGRYLLEKHSAQDLYKAIALFTESAFQDANNILSLIEIVDCYRLLYTYDHIKYTEFLDETRPILLRISKGDSAIDALQVMYCDLRLLEWKFEEAGQFCRKALAINPNSLKGRLRYSELLMQSRNFTAALEQLQRIITIDPLSSLLYTRIGRLFYLMREYDNALSYLNDALDLDSNNHEALALRGAVYSDVGCYSKAIEDYEGCLQVEHHTELQGRIAVVYAKQNKYDKACKLLDTLKNMPDHTPGRSVSLAHIYLTLGQNDKAYEFLEQAVEQHEPDVRALTYDHRWNTLWSEARFGELTARVGLPPVKY